jgi:serine/threonine protein kinase
MHKHNIIHFDIKTTNIMFDEMENLKIIDFGIAHFASEYEREEGYIRMGTPPYFPPEKIL